MLILLDVDEVLTDLVTGVNTLYNARNGTSFKREDYSSCRWWEIWGCDYDYADRLCHEFVVGDEHRKMKPIPGSVEGVKRLKREGHNLVIATSRKTEYDTITREWLNKIHGIDTFDAVHLLNYYGDHGEKRKKSEVANELGVDLAIDDQTRHATDITTVGVPCLILDSPWNKEDELPNLATRVNSWDDILREVEQRSKS